MVCVNPNKAGVKAHCPLKERDQCTHGARIDSGDRNGQRLALIVEKRRPRSQQQPMQVVTGCDARLYLERRTARLQNTYEDDEEVGDTLAELLNIGVLVSRSFITVNAQALTDQTALQVQLLAE